MAEGYSAGADCQDDAARHAPDDPARDVSAKKWPPRGAGCVGGRQPSSDMGFGGRGLAPEAQTLLRSEAFVPSRCCFLTVGGLSWLVMPERGMTLPERVAKFLRDGADTAYCERVHSANAWSRPRVQQVQQITVSFALGCGFEQKNGICAACNEARQIIRSR